MNLKDLNKKKVIIGIAIAVAVAILAVIISIIVKEVSTEDYYDLKIGEETIAVFATEEEAKAVIDDIEQYYVAEGAEVKSLEVKPVMTTVKTTYKVKEAPKLNQEPKELVEYIVSGTKERTTYKVKDGDTIWSIAMENDFSLEEVKKMNPDLDLENIYPGDEISLYEMKPLVKIKLVQLVTSTKPIKFKTVKKKSDELLKNTTKVEQKGKNGKKRVTELITSVNGEATKTEVKKSKVLKKPVKQILVAGTKEIPVSEVSDADYGDGATYDGSGQAVADYALQFVGNPYEYGGSSLTDGADCSGFVMAVYDHFGVSMAHDAGVMRGYGKEVSLSEAQPGDLVCYYGHVGLYIGGGQIVHAIDYGYDIGITSVHYSSKPVLTVRRIFE